MSDLPKDTKEFAAWLRSIADQVDRIPVREMTMREEDVEVGFYYANPMFPQMPTGIHFQVEAVGGIALGKWDDLKDDEAAK